jgi:DNA-binding SARP family transcriptional activator/streptogramin lyase
MGGRLGVSILGPLEVTRDGDPVVVRAGMERTLLALLALSANEVVGRETLVDQLWDDHPPRTASTSLHGLVSQLRKELEPDRAAGEPGRALITHPPGYALALEPEAVDATRFERLLHDGRAAAGEGDPARARAVLAEALALWRGPALADVGRTSEIRAEALRLDELRLEALGDRIEADLALGRHQELVSELEGIVAREPLRERFREQLMMALYRSGRQADALEEYRRARELLRDELGIEPGPGLRELEQQILLQEPALAPPRSPAQRAARRRRLSLAVIGGLAAVGVVAVASWRIATGPPPIVAAPPAVAVLDPANGRVVDTVPVGSGPAAVAFGHGSVWVASADDGTVTRIDPRSREVERVIGVGKPCVHLAIGPGAVWVANGSAGTVTRIDPASDTIADTVDLSGSDPVVRTAVHAVAVGNGAVWAGTSASQLVRLDPTTGRITARYRVDGAPISLTAGLGSLWAGVMTEQVLRIDPGSGRVTARVPVLGAPYEVTIADGRVLVSAGSLWVVDPDVAFPAPTPRIGTDPVGAADVPGPGAWVAERRDGVAIELAPTGSDGRSPVDVGRDPSGIAYGAERLWISVREPTSVR